MPPSTDWLSGNMALNAPQPSYICGNPKKKKKGNVAITYMENTYLLQQLWKAKGPDRFNDIVSYHTPSPLAGST